MAGTALATTLLATSVTQIPAAAAEQVQTPVELITLNDIRILVNSSKLDTTLGTTINNLNVAASAIAATNFSVDAGSLLLEDLTQVIDGTQTISFKNFISIINSGEIDPLVGISGQINNVGIAFEIDAAALSNISGDVAGLSFSDLSQYLYLDQANYAANTIRERNSAKVTADRFGMFAEINNLDFASFANAAAANNVNGELFGVSVGRHLQLIDLDQINQLSNTIQIFNSGEIDPAVGIFAGINNSFTAAFANAIEAANVNCEAGAVDADAVTQVIEFHQANVLSNSIVIDNTGPIEASRTGILAEINNFDILGFGNTSESDNVNGDAAVIEFGDHRQSLYQAQTNSMSSSIFVNNRGVLDSRTGIVATISNEDIDALENIIDGSSVSGSAVAFDFDDRIQEFDGSQTNRISNEINVKSSAEIEAGDTGISTGIGNLEISLEKLTSK